MFIKGKAVIHETIEYIDYNNFGINTIFVCEHTILNEQWLGDLYNPDEIINPEVIKYKR